MEKRIYLTTSWDDGHKLDLKIVKLMKKYGIKGTFYVSPKNRQFKKSDLLTDKEIKSLAKDYEVGAHTMTHPLLPDDISTTIYKVKTYLYKLIRGKKSKIYPNISKEEAWKEISESKKYLEKLLNKKVVSFCYPAGRHNKSIQNLVKKSGFKYARTIESHKFRSGENLLAVPTSLHADMQYQDILKIAQFSHWNPKTILENLNWETLAKRMFDNLKSGDTFHFWGHSWIIEENGDWEKLERVLKYFSSKKGVTYIENRDLLR